MKLSCGLIVKNEQEMLPACLKSIKDADEIVVVDTGSTDKTKEIASKYTDKIYDFPWIDDFAAARNFAISKCTGDWILSVDADHIIQTPIKKIKEEIKKAKGKVLMIKSKAGKHTHWRDVLFKNDKEVFWVGKVHECLSILTKEKVNVERVCNYSKNHYKDPDRNLRILLKSDTNLPRIQFYLGREYFEKKKYDEPIQWFEKYLQRNTWFLERAEAYLCLAKIYWNTQKGDKAREMCSLAIRWNPMFKEALKLMSEMHFEPQKSKWLKLSEAADNSDVLFIRS
jgi:glycosyltransferase involved in cell wall biosynthesis